MRTDSLHGRWEVHTPTDDNTIEITYFTTKEEAMQYYKQHAKGIQRCYVCKNRLFD
jgi:PP-loop superfamily ATP-utilizing enzyme